MMLTNSITAVMTIVVAILIVTLIASAFSITYASNVLPQQQLAPPLVEYSDSNNHRYQNAFDGFRVQIPEGWVIDDIDNTDPAVREQQNSTGWGNIAIICAQNQTLPRIGGGYACSTGGDHADFVRILKFTDLQSKPEFAVLVRENKSITTSDFLAYYMHDLEKRVGFTDFSILENTDRVVNMIDPQTNQTIATVPAKYVEMSFSYPTILQTFRGKDTDFLLLVLSDDGNTAYMLYPEMSHLTAEGELIPEHQEIFDSFELVTPATPPTPPMNATTAATTTPTIQNQTQEENQQSNNNATEEEPGITTITIPQGASTQGNPHYNPDMVQVPLNGKVVWDNQDTVPHTATSGTGPSDPECKVV